MFHAFIYGFILAFGLIIPLGLQNLFIFNQGATQRHLIHAMPSVVTAAFCDSVLIVIAVSGVSLAVLSIPGLKTTIFILGFFFLMYMGWITWQSKSQRKTENTQPYSPKRQISFAISVSLLNPPALLDTVGVIGTNSLRFMGQEKWIYTLACIAVSCLWFLGLSIAGHYLQKLDQTGTSLNIINKISALVIWAVGICIGYQLFI